MASYKEIIALGRDPVRVRAVAHRLLASAEDWTEWERDFLGGLVAEYGSDALSAPQREKLAELRHGAEYVSKVEELDVASLIEKCWPLRLDLDYKDDIAFIEQERGSSSRGDRPLARTAPSATHKLLKLLYAASEIGSFNLRSRHARSLG
jgi:hypothetical protein